MATADKTYVDPSALRRQYIHDSRSRAFCAWRARIDGSLPLTLHGRKALESAGDLSQQFTPRLGTRSLDVLHVASALVLGCKSFVTYDEKQAALARAVKLRLIQP